ncbi:MAG: alpha/beta hydrolase, partial [Pseudomonadota bacterium]
MGVRINQTNLKDYGMTSFPEPSLIQLPDITLSVHDGGAGPAVVLCHGFPELARSWRYQFGPLCDAGFRVIAPDQRGYGGSDAPKAVEDYDLVHLTGDLVNLLDVLEIDKAIFVGHDWGGLVAWAMPVMHPDRCLGVVGVNTPYVAMPSTDAMR